MSIFRRALFVVAVGAAVMVMALVAPSGGGQSSLRPPVMEDVSATPAPHLITKPAWQHAIFIPESHGAIIASDAETAYFSVKDAVCAVRLADGRDRWCAGSPASTMALAGGTLATVETDGVIRGRNKNTGAVDWRTVLVPVAAATGSSPVSIQKTSSTIESTPSESVWSTGQSFLVLRAISQPPPLTTTIAELSFDGKQWWVWSGEGSENGAPMFGQPYAVVNLLTSGATTEARTELFKLGKNNGEIGVVGSGSNPIAFRSPKLYSNDVCCNRAPGDYSPAFQISVADVRPGVPGVDWHYQPDYEETSKLPVGTTCCGSSKGVGIEGPYLYGSISERLYRYDLAAPEGQQPVLLSEQGVFIAGPYAERAYVARPDGVWSVHFNGRYVYQRLVIPYRLPTTVASIEFADRVGYASLTDGTMLAFAVDTGEPLIRAKTSCSQVAGITVTKSRVIYVCGGPQPMAIAFPRVKAPSQ